MISTQRHAEYAMGFLALGLLEESSAELEKIADRDRFHPVVLAARIELHTQEKKWPRVIAAAEELTRRRPDMETGWVGWAYALRELNRVKEALVVLLQAETNDHGSAIVHYNLACYLALLGNQKKAVARLKKAFRLDPNFKDEALDDKDLASLWDDIQAMS